MNRILKYGLLGAGGCLGVAMAGAAYVAMTFDPNDYKDKIVQAVKEETERNLRLEGDIKLSFFPNIGAELGKVSLSEAKSEKEFAAVERARVSLALIPLLSKQVVVDEVAVSGLNATLVKRQDGTTNMDDLLGEKKPGHKEVERPAGPSGEGRQVKFDISSVAIDKTSLTYRDEATGAQYAIKELTLETGRIAENVPSQINLSVGVQANQPKLDLTPRLKTTLIFDLDKKQYRLQEMELQVRGTALDISNLNLQVKGDLSADAVSREFSVSKLALEATGVKDKDNFSAKLEAPALSLGRDKFSGDKLVLNAKLDGAAGTIAAAFSLPGVKGDAGSFALSAFVLDLDVKQPEQMFKVKLTSPLTGNLKARQFAMNNFTLAVDASGDKLPNKSVKSEMKGNLQVDAGKESVQLDLAGGLLQSQVKAKVGVNGFASPAIRFDVEMDQLDADLYLPKKTTTAKSETPAAKAAKEPEKPLDLSGLRKLNVDGSLRVGELKVANVKSSQVRVDVKAHNGQVDISPLSAKLYGGSMNGTLGLNAQATPRIAVNQTLTGINVGPLTKDAANFDALEGKGDVAMNLAMQGDTVSAMKKAMNGTMSLNLADGAIKGINIAKKLRDAQSMVGMAGAKAETQSANSEEKTDFSELKATFKVTDGVAHNDDLLMKSPLLRMTGAGDIDIGRESMDYTAKATLAKTLKGQGGADTVGGITVPVRARGPFSDLKYTLDFEAMAGEAAKQKIEATKGEVKTRVQEQLKGRLPGLFK